MITQAQKETVIKAEFHLEQVADALVFQEDKTVGLLLDALRKIDRFMRANQ
jgi:hypothetical protein